MSLTLTDTSLIRHKHFIDGNWLDSLDQQQFPVTNPASETLITRVADGSMDDARSALDAAEKAYIDWRKVPARQRAQLLKRWHALVLEHEVDLGRLISLEQGKPLAEGCGEIRYAASYIEWFAEQAPRISGEVIEPPSADKRMMAVREPVGVVAVITPWNFPAAMIARKIAPALAAGCSVVAKPAEDTPLTSLALMQLLHQAGLPAGVVNIVCASRERTPEVVSTWLMDARVRKVSFTGSTGVGRHLAEQSAATLKKLSLELGGNAPFIVFEDADLEAAVEGLMAAKFRNGGQTCVCPNRVYVQSSVFDAFADRLVSRVSALKVGPADDLESQIGPMINARAVTKILEHIDDAVGRGARVLAGGRQILENDGPHYVAPTVLADVSPDSMLTGEETFGPMVPLMRFDTEHEVVAKANDTPYGLAAYFYTSDPARIWRVAESLESGIVGINEGAVASEAAPFGGIKASGYGREGSVHGLDDYMHIKYLCQGNIQTH